MRQFSQMKSHQYKRTSCFCKPVPSRSSRAKHHTSQPAVQSSAHLDVVGVVQGKPVVDALRQDQQVALLGLNTDPLVIVVAHIKVACSTEQQGTSVSMHPLVRLEQDNTVGPVARPQYLVSCPSDTHLPSAPTPAHTPTLAVLPSPALQPHSRPPALHCTPHPPWPSST